MLCVKIFHGIEYSDTSWYKSCFLVDFNGVSIFLLNLKIFWYMLCVKIFHGIEYSDTSWYKSCFLVDFNGVCGGIFRT